MHVNLKSKKCEGYDRIPVCCIYDARESLQVPMASLFEKIYNTCVVPEQWKISKIMPIFKKGCKNAIENYRPIANLCSASKIFEKLILKQIHYLESTNKLDLTGKQQHGFIYHSHSDILAQFDVVRDYCPSASCYLEGEKLFLIWTIDIVIPSRGFKPGT